MIRTAMTFRRPPESRSALGIWSGWLATELLQLQNLRPWYLGLIYGPGGDAGASFSGSSAEVPDRSTFTNQCDGGNK